MTSPPAKSARDWLESRRADVPPSLQQRMLSALPAAGSSDDPAPLHLAAAAMECLRDATACGDDRSAAIHLLAADALMTDACEMAAADPALLRRIADIYRPDALAVLHSSGRPGAGQEGT